MTRIRIARSVPGRGRSAAYDPRVTEALRVERSGPDGVGRARHAGPAGGAERVRCLADRRAPVDVRGTRARFGDGPASGRPRRRGRDVLCRRGHRLDAGRDGARCRGQRAGRDGDGRHVRDHRHVPGAGHRAGPGRGARGRDGPLRGERPRDRRVGGADSGSPRRGSASCPRSSRRSSSRRSANRTPVPCSPAAAGSMPCGRSGSGSCTRSSRARRRSISPSMRRSRDILASGPTAVRAAKAIVREVRGLGPRLVEVAHRASHRAPANERGGAGRLRGVHREASSRLGRALGCLRRRRRGSRAQRRSPVSAATASCPVIDGPIHRYMTASPGCWRAYTELLGGGLPPSPAAGLTVDAYAVDASRRARAAVDSFGLDPPADAVLRARATLAGRPGDPPSARSVPTRSAAGHG